MGAQVPEPHIALRSEVGRDVCSALGIPGALYSGTDGGSSREAYRQLLTATLEPWAEIIKAEFREKIGYPVDFNLGKSGGGGHCGQGKSLWDSGCGWGGPRGSGGGVRVGLVTIGSLAVK